MQNIKALLKWVWPASSNTFKGVTDNLKIDLAKIQKQLNTIVKAQEKRDGEIECFKEDIKEYSVQLNEEIKCFKEDIKEYSVQLNEEIKYFKEDIKGYSVQLNEEYRILKVVNEEIRCELQQLKEQNFSYQSILNEILDKLNESNGQEEIKKQQHEIMSNVESIRKQVGLNRRSSDEVIWAEIFNNTITDTTWLKNPTFSPGRWAIGYPTLYAIYRVLNEVRPRRVLELGLGQSTRMIGQYASAFQDVEHLVVEHDREWINFFNNNFEISSSTKIIQRDLGVVAYGNIEEVRVFQGFKEALDKKTLDFIFIDAPLGADMKTYARIDILQLLPECLEDSFVIILDDSERSGEKGTLLEIEKILKENNIEYAKGVYSGKKDMTILSSIDNKFVCSM